VTEQEPVFAGRSPAGTFAMVLAAIAALFVIDTFLAKMERTEDRAEANRLFSEGRKLMQQGNPAMAAQRFDDAVAIERENRDYRLALAEALLASGKIMEAESTLADLLEANSTDGAVNLAMARALLSEGKTTEAISFYHRAIYGQWKDHPLQNQVKVRFELVDLLARRHAKEELLAELLPLENEAPPDVDTRKRLGELFIAAGSPARAVGIFRDVIRRNPQDAQAYRGLGEAEFARGNYRSAQADFLAASRLNPDDSQIRERLELCSEVLSLDPTQRGLDAGERFQRSRKLLELALKDLDQCPPGALPSDTQQAVEKANQALKHPARITRGAEAADSNIDTAEQIWQARKKYCNPSNSAAGEPLDLVLAKIAQ
jgi:tetratricopeptide (TPR) repeat protein